MYVCVCMCFAAILKDGHHANQVPGSDGYHMKPDYFKTIISTYLEIHNFMAEQNNIRITYL